MPCPVIPASRLRRLIWLAAAWFGLAACATAPDPTPQLEAWQPMPALLLGEVHDAPGQDRLQQTVVMALARSGRLAALVLEMAERGRSTTDLPAHAGEADVRAALDWNERGWPWQRYRPAVMAAVRAGVPVFGGNLPQASMRSAMRDTRHDTLLDAPALAQQQEAIRAGHCGLLPEAQIPGMARIQIARDESLAQTVSDAWRPGQTVVLLSGNEHARRDVGVPRHLDRLAPPGFQGDGAVRVVRMAPAAPNGEAVAPRDVSADAVWLTAPSPPRDHCAELRQQWRR